MNAVAMQRESKVASLAKLAEPQRILLEAFERNGLTLDVVAQTLLSVLQEAELDADKIAAARLAIMATIGLAPTNQRSLHLHAHSKSDAFFNEEKLAATPPPKID